jgi:hypothetical protein
VTCSDRDDDHDDDRDVRQQTLEQIVRVAERCTHFEDNFDSPRRSVTYERETDRPRIVRGLSDMLYRPRVQTACVHFTPLTSSLVEKLENNF